MTTAHTADRDSQVAAFIEKLGGVADVLLVGQGVKLTEEAQEVSEAIWDYHRWDRPHTPDAVIGELADVIIVCHTIAALLDVGTDQLMQAVDTKLDINLKRDWARDGSGAFHHTEGGAA